MTVTLSYDPRDTARCIKDNLIWFEEAHPTLAREGFLMLAQVQLDSLIQMLTVPLQAGYDRHDPTPREAAEHVEINLRAFAYRRPEVTRADTFSVAYQQLAVLIERLPPRPPEDDPYIDPRYETRLCDCCEKPYRGPAVYCSRRCAYADS